MNLQAVFDKTAAFAVNHKFLTAAGGVGVLGAGFGGFRRYRDTAGESPDVRARESFSGAAGTGIVAAGVAGAGIAAVSQPARSIFKAIGGGIAGSTGRYLKREWAAATSAKTISGALNHLPIAMGVGGIAGAVLGSQIADDPREGIAIGSVVGAGAGIMARAGSRMASDWKALPGLGKAAVLVAAAAGAGLASRAYLHEDSFDEESTAVSDGTGGYEVAPGPRDRATAMNATGDLVLGLHAKRH